MGRLTPVFIIILLGLIFLVNPFGVWAGEPTGEIGPMNPTMFKCVSRDGKELIQPDPFRKPTTRVFVRGGEEFELEPIEDYLERDPNARELICNSGLQIDFGFDTKEAQQFNAYLEELEEECEEKDEFGKIVPIRDTRVEGYVYEFHPRDPENPETSEWFGVRSQKVPVIAKGITFEIFWNTDDNGSYYFPNLGAGPILLNLKLPPDAHVINPNVLIESTGLEETQRVDLGFYRGDVPPPEPELLVTPDGGVLPFLTLGDVEILSTCGYADLPSLASSIIDPPETDSTDEPGMPNVGGVLTSTEPPVIIALAAALLVLLPVVGLLTARKR